MTRVNEKRTRMLSICGSELSRVITRPRIPGTEFIVLRGLRILTTRIELTLDPPPRSNRVSQPRITTRKSSYILIWCSQRYTYNVPRISQVWVRPHHKTHSNDLQHHLNTENGQKYVVEDLNQFVLFSCRVLSSQHDTISDDGGQNDLIEPWINHNFDDLFTERICYSTAAQRHCRICTRLFLELLTIFCDLVDDCSW